MPKVPSNWLPLTLLLAIGTAWGQATSLDRQPLTPAQAALSELVLAELLAVTGGDDALFQVVTGTTRQPTQKLFVNIPDAALQAGTITYPRAPEFLSASLWDQAAQCPSATSVPSSTRGDTKSVSGNRTVDHTGVQQMQLAGARVNSTKSLSIPNTGQWSAVQANARAPEWPIEVTPEFDTSGPVPVQRFRFLPAGTQPASTANTVLRFEAPLSAEFGTKVVYRQQTVLMRGSMLPFTATALVTSAAPLEFNVRTIGAPAGFYFRTGETRVMQLENLPAEGAATPARDAHLGARVLQSPSGAFLLGRELGTPTTGAYSVVDALRSQRPASLQRVWSTLVRGSCTESELVLNTMGDLIFVCNGSGKALYQNTDGSRPCRVLSLSDAGELICQSGHGGSSGVAASVVFQTKGSSTAPNVTALVKTQQAYQKTWQQLTGASTQSFTFTGTYSGDRVVAPVFNCTDSVVTLPAQPQTCTNAVANTRGNQNCTDTRTTMARLRAISQDTAGTQP